MPERSKQQGRRSPVDSLEMATSIRFARVSARFPEVIQCIQSLRASGVMSDHVSDALGVAATIAFPLCQYDMLQLAPRNQ